MESVLPQRKRFGRTRALVWILLVISLGAGLASFVAVWTSPNTCFGPGPLWPHWAGTALLVAGSSALVGLLLAIALRVIPAIVAAIVLFGGCYALFGSMAVIANSDTC
jgi:hypothetical protein